MTLNNEQTTFEDKFRLLVGQAIIKVEYLEIDYQPENPKPFYPTKFDNLHSVDFSILLHTDNDKTIEIYWDGQFFQYGIGLKINEKSDFTGHKIWNVTDNKLWTSFLGIKIVETKLTWKTFTTTEQYSRKTESWTYPQDITLTFSNDKKIFISASGFLDEKDNEVSGMLDNLTVTDNEELARKVKMIN